MNIEVPDDYFPPTGMPFATADQRNLAVWLHNAGRAKVQFLDLRTDKWVDANTMTGDGPPASYRFAPPPDPKRGEFTITCTYRNGRWSALDIYSSMNNWSKEASVRSYRAEIHIKCEELPT